MVSIVQKVIDIEGPVHRDEIARRVAALFGKQKAGSRIVGAVDKALLELQRKQTDYLNEESFWIPRSTKENLALRNRSRAPLNLRRAALLPPTEIAVAIRKVVSENGALSWEELPRAVALLFGFQRTGPEFRPAIQPVIEAMIASEELREGSVGIQLAARP